MATIPASQGPRVLPQTQTSGLRLSGGDRIAQAAAGVGETANQVAGMLANHAEDVYQQGQALARAKAANAAQQYQLDVDAAVADIGDQLRRGADYSQAEQMYDAALQNIQRPTVDGLAEPARVAYDGTLEAASRQGKLKIGALAIGARRDAGQREFATALDLNGKTAGQPGADIAALNARLRQMADGYVQAFGLDASSVDKAVQDRIDANWTQQAAARFNTSHDSAEALEALRRDLTAEDGFYADKLDSDKRNAMALRVDGRIDVLNGRAERAADKLEAAAERALVQMDEQIASGIPATEEQMAAWADTFSKAPAPLQAEFRGRIADARETQALLQQPIEQQLAAVRDKQAALMTQGGDKRARVNFDRLKSAVEGNVKMLSETPLVYLKARLGENVAPLPVESLADPSRAGEVSAQLQHRAVEVEALRKRYGTRVAQNLLLPEEAKALGAVLDAQPPKRRVELFGQLRKVSGSDSTYRAVMQQIAPDAPVTAFAGLLFQKNPRAAGTLAVGDALLNATKGDAAQDGKGSRIKMPSADEFNAAMDDAVGRAFRGRPEAYAIAQQAVRALYAGSIAADGDVSGEFSQRRLNNSIKAVLGETVDVNGAGEVFVPYGMDPDDFEDKVEAAWNATADQRLAGLPSDFDDYGLEQVDDTHYRLTIAGRYASDKTGRPLVLEVKP